MRKISPTTKQSAIREATAHHYFTLVVAHSGTRPKIECVCVRAECNIMRMWYRERQWKPRSRGEMVKNKNTAAIK